MVSIGGFEPRSRSLEAGSAGARDQQWMDRVSRALPSPMIVIYYGYSKNNDRHENNKSGTCDSDVEGEW